MEQKYIVALEFGSSKIKGAVGTYDASNTLTVLSVEEERLTGDELSGTVRYGLIQNVDKVAETVESIRRKLEGAPTIAPRKIDSVYVSIGGRSLFAVSCEVVHQFTEERRITEDIVDMLKNEAKSLNTTGKEVLDVIPRSFSVDNTATINPVGMFGKLIKAQMMLITCKPAASRNLVRAVNERADLKINGYIVRPVAEANMVLTDDEKRLGCMFVDFGAESVSVAIYKGGVMVYLAVLPLGSRNITRDLMMLGNTEERADDIKRSAGNVEPYDASKRNKNPEQLDYTKINEIITARAGEIITNIIEQIRYAELTAADLPGGIVIVGGGAKLKGFTTMLSNQSKLKVRIGTHSGLIRITDPRIHPDECVDVLSLLAEAARSSDLVDCMHAPAGGGSVGTDLDSIDEGIDEDEESRVGDGIPGYKESRRERKERERRKREEAERKRQERERRNREQEILMKGGEYAPDDIEEEEEPTDNTSSGRRNFFKKLQERILGTLEDPTEDSY